jgi:hypothetical protein
MSENRRRPTDARAQPDGNHLITMLMGQGEGANFRAARTLCDEREIRDDGLIELESPKLFWLGWGGSRLAPRSEQSLPCDSCKLAKAS